MSTTEEQLSTVKKKLEEAEKQLAKLAGKKPDSPLKKVTTHRLP